MELDQRIAELCYSLENCDPSELKHIQGKIAEAKRIRANFNRTNVSQPLSDLIKNLK